MKQKGIVFFLLLALLAVTVGDTSYATERKKKTKKHAKKRDEDEYYSASSSGSGRHSRKEQRRKKREEYRKEKREAKYRKYYEGEQGYTQDGPVKKEAAFKYPPSVMKNRYRVDVLAAMYLDELVKKGAVTDKIPDKALPGIAFYEGLTIAADSLKKAGYNIDIYVHDVASTKEAPDSLIKSGALDSADLIIGAVQSHDVPVLAAYAKDHKVNFVSALSPSDGGVKSNKYFTLIQPSLKTHCNWILSDIAQKFPGLHVSLLYRTMSQADENAYRYLTEDNDVNLRFRQLQCNMLPNKEALSNLFDTTKPNIVVASLLDPAAADSLLKELSRDFPGTHFEVYGMPSWTIIPNLRRDHSFPNLSINVTVPFNIDAASPAGKYVSRTYKNNYGGKATEYVYRGFEAMFWYAGLLKQYGTYFNSNYRDNTAAPFTRFEVMQRRDNGGHILYSENTHIFLSKYEAGKVQTE